MKHYKENLLQFWEDIYLADDTGWDLGEPTPVFDKIGDDLPSGKVCILGCGRGYDAVMFAQKGFEVTAVDFAPSAVTAMHSLANSKAVKINILFVVSFFTASAYGSTKKAYIFSAKK